MLNTTGKKAKINRLKQQISKVTDEQGMELDEVLHEDMHLIVTEERNTIYSKYPEDSFQRLFWEQHYLLRMLTLCIGILCL